MAEPEIVKNSRREALLKKLEDNGLVTRGYSSIGWNQILEKCKTDGVLILPRVTPKQLQDARKQGKLKLNDEVEFNDLKSECGDQHKAVDLYTATTKANRLPKPLLKKKLQV